MDRKRKLDSTYAEDVMTRHGSLTIPEIVSIIIAIDDSKSLQENIKNKTIRNINMHITEHTRKTILMKACEAGSIECVKVLLANNSNVNDIDYYQKSALSYAAESGNVNILNIILSHDELDIDLVYETLHEPLSIISPSFPLSIEIVKLLVSRLPDVNRRVHGDCILLNHAVRGGYLDIVRLLLIAGADPCITDVSGRDALELASKEGRIDAIRLLFESNSPNTITTESISNAYLCACYYGRIDIVRYLLSKGADVNATEEDGYLAIDYVISDSMGKSNILLTKLLIESGFNVNAIYLLRSVLYYACIQRSTEVVQLLLEHGAHPDIHYPDGHALLPELVEETCQLRADYTEYITLLLGRGANVNIAHSVTGLTALMIAGSAANIDLVKLLLEHGADVTQVNREGKSVLDIGRTRSHSKVAELYEQYIDSNRVDAKAILK